MAQGSTSSGAGSRILIPALLITTVVTGLMAGFFYAYASSVMIGLADASDATFIEAMQQINANVRNVWFGPVFFGSVVLPIATSALAIINGDRATRVWVLTMLLFAVVAFGITVGVSVPLNNELADAGAPQAIADLAQVRADYEEPWIRWNIYRTLASTAALVSGCLALANARARTPSSLP